MLHSTSLPMPLQNILWSKNNTLAKNMALLLFGVVVLAIASQLVVPLTPVPITFQSATVILIGMAFGPRLGTSIVITYLIAGIVGFPVFASFSSGLNPFFGPTSGYLIGFIPAAFISGYLAQWGFARNVARSFLAASVGTSIIFLFGITMLSRFVGWHNAFLLGFMPFVFTETVKLFFVSFLIPKMWKHAN